MQISDTWEIEDAVSGLRLKIIPGTKQDRLHVESLTGGTATDDHPKMNRDFWFTKDGKFDGTGAVVEDRPGVLAGVWRSRSLWLDVGPSESRDK